MEAYTPRADERTLQAQIQELMCYIWDNYLQLYDGVEDIVLMGVGNAYLGIKMLLINRRAFLFSPTFPFLRPAKHHLFTNPPPSQSTSKPASPESSTSSMAACGP